ncbi:hypothetical protein [Alloscardovia omnicolens]|uniref:hypothetical protein n=1 Tax=Alloscardovia omnicolens TaxID=419015 RepID=UPI003A79D3FC
MFDIKSTQQKDKAAQTAKSYVGRPYRGPLERNKHKQGAMNCSQLVWAAWWYGGDVDLDNPVYDDGIVWPRDLRNSQKAQIYKTI